MNYLKTAEQIYDMIRNAKLMEAFEQFYHEDVVMIEADGETREGKDRNRQSEKDFLGSVREFHGMGVDSITSNEDKGITTVSSWMDITFQDNSRKRIEQTAVQQWKGDKIVRERFYESNANVS